MKNKGFTLVELLAVIVIMAILVLMAIPAYNSITNNMKKKQNENIINYIELQAEKFVSEEKITGETDEFSFTVGTLLSSGYLDSDESDKSIYYDAYNKDIVCNVIKINYKNGKPHAKFTEDNDCKLNSQNLANELMEVKAYRTDNLEKINPASESNFEHRLEWVNSDVLLLLQIKNNDKNIDDSSIKSVTWTTANNKIIKSVGVWLKDEDKNSYNQSGTYLNTYEITSSNITDGSKIKVSIDVEYGDNKKASLSTYVVVRIDKQAPTITTSSNDNWTMNEKTITLFGDDKKGSGIRNFCISQTKNVSEAQIRECNSDGLRKVELKKGSKTKGELKESYGEYYAWAIDNVGNVSKTDEPAYISIINIDNTAPECVYTNESTEWSTSRIIKIGCSDSQSGCKTGELEYNLKNETIKTRLYNYSIEDKAGNKTTCSKEMNIYIDNTKPTCSISGASTNWAKSRTITIQCKDSDSGCTDESSKTISYTTSKVTDSQSFEIKDKVGNTATCNQKNYNVYVDNDKPSVSATNISYKTKGTLQFTIADTTSGINGYIVSTSSTAPTYITNYTTQNNDTSIKNITDTYTAQSNAAGVYYVHAIDRAGNTSTSSGILLDPVSPNIDKVTNNGTTFTIHITDNYGLSNATVVDPDTTNHHYNITGKDTNITYTVPKAGTYTVIVQDSASNYYQTSFTAAQNLFCQYTAGQTWKFSSTKAMQTFTVPCAGTYNISATGGRGGMGAYIDFSAGTCSYHDHIKDNDIYKKRWPGSVSASYKFTSGQVLYVNVGGSGGDGNTIAGGDVHYSCSPNTGSAGYNGGSKFTDGGGSGGATTIALVNGNYSTDLLNSGNLLLCAKGGAGLKSNNYISFESKAGAGTNYINSNSTYYVGSSTTNSSLTSGSPIVEIKLVSLNN